MPRRDAPDPSAGELRGDAPLASRHTAPPQEADARTDLVVEAPGADEVTIVPWPILWRNRIASKVEGHDKYPWIVLSAALFGLFSVGFSITVLSIAIKGIAEEFHTSDNVVIWVITGPLLLGAVVTPASGKLADLFGARRVYLTAMGFVGLFAGLAAIAWSAESLIAFRVVGAAIGTATGPAAIALINRLFPRERRAQALGYWSLVAAGGPVLGVVIGGPVIEAVGWRAIFVAQVPLTLATVGVCAAVFPETPRNRAQFDYVGALLLGLGAASFVMAINRAPETGWGWTNPVVVLGLAAAPILIGAFALYERRITNQLIPTKYFPQRNFSFSMANQFFSNFAYMGAFFLTPLFLQRVLEYSTAKTGFVSIARPMLFAIAGPIAGWAATKVGERVNALVGGVCLLASMLAFVSISDGSGEVMVFAALALSGIGMGVTAPAVAAAVANTVDESDLGVAGGTQQMISLLGVVVGTQIMFTVQQAALGEWLNRPADLIPDDVWVHAYDRAYLVGAAAAALSITAALFIRSTTKDGQVTRAVPPNRAVGAPGRSLARESSPGPAGPRDRQAVGRCDDQADSVVGIESRCMRG